MTRLSALVKAMVDRHKMLRYFVVSIVAATTTTIVLAVMMDVAGLSNLQATFVASMTAALPAFELSRRWVWSHSDRRKVVRQALGFWGLAAIRISLALLAVKAASIVVGSWSTGPRTVAVEAAMLGAYGVLWIAQYAVLDRVLFRTRRSAEPAPEVVLSSVAR